MLVRYHLYTTTRAAVRARMRTPDTEQTIMIVLSSDPDSGSGVVACAAGHL